MRIQFHGAARETTGSSHIIEVNGKRILLDCGLCQGKRKKAFERNRSPSFEPGSIDACVLSHAHIDHSGNLPTLVKRGFKGPIYATPATCDLCEIMLLDSAYLQTRDVQYVNKKRTKQGRNPFEPLYTREDIPPTLQRLAPAPYETPIEVAPGAVVTLHDAGHILGSASVTIDITENGRAKRLFFTGDLGRRKMPILKDPVVVHDVDLMITESTYGNRLHPQDEDVKQCLTELCQKVSSRSSRLIIPAFSVGRTQQIIYFLHELWREGRTCEIPVYVDSPLSSKATAVHDEHPECYDAEAMAMLRKHGEPFSFATVRYVTTLQESKRLNRMRGPVIIVSASGMCEGGRILHHLKHTVEDEANVILIVGYQAEHTLGRRLVHRRSPIKIFGEKYTLRAEVKSLQALSAHADRDELLAYYREMGPQITHAFVVHGEMDQSQPLAEAIAELGARNVTIPKRGQTFEF